MQRDPFDITLDIVAASKAILRFVEGRQDSELKTDELLRSGVLHQFLVLGEAARRLPDDFRARLPDIPWPKIIGMRNILIHQYDAVDDAELWRAIRRDLPDLIARLEPLLPKEKP